MGRHSIYTKESVIKLFTEKNLELMADELNRQLLLSKNNTITTRTRLKYKCKICGFEGEKTLKKILDGHGCPECAIKARMLSFRVVKKAFSEKNYTLLSKESDYENAHSPLSYKCHCGYEGITTYNDLVYGEKGCPECAKKRTSGENHYRFNPNLTEEDRKRKNAEYDHWRKEVFKINDYTCQCCRTRGGDLEAHHNESFADNEEVRYEVSNGTTLCTKCHTEFHKTYGYGKNTTAQLNEFIANKKGINNNEPSA